MRRALRPFTSKRARAGAWGGPLRVCMYDGRGRGAGDEGARGGRDGKQAY